MPSNYFQSFRDMVVWQQAFDFAREAHALAKRLPSDERFGLASSLARASVAVPAEIAQGQRKRGKEFVRHLSSASAHAAECETYLLLIQDLFPDETDAVNRLREKAGIVQKMLSALSYALGRGKEAEKEGNGFEEA